MYILFDSIYTHTIHTFIYVLCKIYKNLLDFRTDLQYIYKFDLPAPVSKLGHDFLPLYTHNFVMYSSENRDKYTVR